MLSTTNKGFTWLRIFMSAEDGAGGADPAAADAAAAAAAKDATPPADKAPAADADKKPDAADKPATEWKEFVPDPAKSEAENAAAKAEHDKGSPANQVPADGKYDLKMPEGMTVDQALLDAVAPDFKDMGLTQAQAQKLADKFAAHVKAQGDAKSADFAKEVDGWIDQAKADKEMGGDKWGKTAEAASGVIAEFGTDGLKSYLNASGGGNHPELIRFASKVGAELTRLRALIKEDSPATDTAPGGKVASDSASILYPNDTPKKG